MFHHKSSRKGSIFWCNASKLSLFHGDTNKIHPVSQDLHDYYLVSRRYVMESNLLKPGLAFSGLCLAFPLSCSVSRAVRKVRKLAKPKFTDVLFLTNLATRNARNVCVGRPQMGIEGVSALWLPFFCRFSLFSGGLEKLQKTQGKRPPSSDIL